MSYRTYIAASKAAYIAGIEAGISPQELRAHTGVIGEAFVADYLSVKLTPENNQPGFDLVDGDGLRVSVKTITTSTGVSLNENTLTLVDRIVVVWIDTIDDNLELSIVYDKSVDEFVEDSAAPYRGSIALRKGAMTFPNRPTTTGKFELGDVIETISDGKILIRRHVNGSFTVLDDGIPQPARSYLLKIRDKRGLPAKNNDTTRSLGSQIFRSQKDFPIKV